MIFPNSRILANSRRSINKFFNFLLYVKLQALVNDTLEKSFALCAGYLCMNSFLKFYDKYFSFQFCFNKMKGAIHDNRSEECLWTICFYLLHRAFMQSILFLMLRKHFVNWKTNHKNVRWIYWPRNKKYY